jgi:hypothetical protein
MYRRWKNSDQPKEEQTPARATANEAALKRDYRSGMSVVGTVEITTGHNVWEASDQRRISGAPLYGVAFLAFGRFAAEVTCQRAVFAVVSDLPIKRLTRATRKGQSKLAADRDFAGECI